MAQATTIKGGKVRVLLDLAGTGSYAAPCGFTQRSITLSKGLEEVRVPDCDDPDSVDWLGRDASSLSMAVAGEGVLAAESVETWFDAFESVESVAAKIELEFAAATYTWTGRVHVETLSIEAPNGQRAALNVSMQSDGEMVRTSSP